jgi:hypothetical protein
MHSHRRPRGKIFFEVLCALLIGASFVGAWIQTGAWAFLGPAFVFTLFGLYWSFDMFGSREPVRAAIAAEPTAAPAFVRESESVAAQVEIRTFEPAEEFVAAFEPAAVFEQPAALAAAPSPEPVAEAKPKRRSKKARPEAVAIVAEPVVAPDPQPIVDPDPEPVVEHAPATFDEAPSFAEDEHHESHIEPLFDPQPFARQARPAFGKRPRGPGPRPLPA